MRHTVRMTSPRAIAGKKFQAYRSKKGFSSQAALADAAGSSVRMVAEVEAGKPVGDKTTQRLDRAMGWKQGYGIEALHRGEEPVDEEPVDAVASRLHALYERSEQIKRKLDLVPEVYDNYGKDAARAAIAALSAEFAELQEEIAQLQRGDKSTPQAG